MIVAAVAVLLVQSAVVWETPPEAAAPAPVAEQPVVQVPEWARSDPFAYERARCSPLVRGDKPLETCQAETRAMLAAALGDDLPDALRPAGADGDCQMMRESSGGSAYALQCGPQRRDAPVASQLQEQDCRSRPDRRGGFTSECRPVVEPGEKKDGLRLRLWGDD